MNTALKILTAIAVGTFLALSIVAVFMTWNDLWAWVT